MSLPHMDVPVALPPPALRPRPGRQVAQAEAMRRIRALSHYRPDYDYRPDRYQYTERYTSDPHYVVCEVRPMMSPTRDHGEWIVHLRHALGILTQAAVAVHVSVDVDIIRIPGTFFGSERHTSAVRPDLAVWPVPEPDHNIVSYRYDRDGAPQLAMEVVSHSDQEMRDNDWVHKMAVYAAMGIQEYWLVDTRPPQVLRGYTLDAGDGTPHCLSRYRPLEMDAEGGMDSGVLAASLRWATDGLECWHAAFNAWVLVEDLPLQQAELKGELKGELKTWGTMLHRVLDAEQPGAADQVLQCWAQTPPKTWPSNETLDQLEAAPENWKLLLLGESDL